MLNRIVLIGRLTRDPELRYTSNGTAVCNFTLAVERNYTNSKGERDVDFINVVAWRGLAENVSRHLGKGRLVGVDGSLQIRKSESNGRTYINPDVHADNVRFLDFAKDGKGSNNNKGSNQEKTQDFDEQFNDQFDADDFDVPF